MTIDPATRCIKITCNNVVTLSLSTFSTLAHKHLEMVVHKVVMTSPIIYNIMGPPSSAMCSPVMTCVKALKMLLWN